MKIKSALMFGMAVLAAGYGMAAAPVLRTSKTVTIDASAYKVWHTARDFNALHTWHPGLASDEIVEGTNNTVGAVRLLTLKGGGTIKEKLLAFDEQAHSFKYAILESVLPVSDYTCIFVVKSLGKRKSSAVWSGRFKRKNVGENPGDKENDKAAIDTVEGIYTSGLDSLKKIVEAK